MASKDHTAPQLLVEAALAIDLLKVLLQEGVRHALGFMGGVARVAGMAQRVLVYIRTVHLHPVPERRGAHLLREYHDERVGLLSGGTPRRPDADGLARALG